MLESTIGPKTTVREKAFADCMLSMLEAVGITAAEVLIEDYSDSITISVQKEHHGQFKEGKYHVPKSDLNGLWIDNKAMAVTLKIVRDILHMVKGECYG